MIDGTQPAVEHVAVQDAPGEQTFISYAEFGRRFFETAVTRSRVEAAAAGIAGRPIEVGPLPVGPLGLVKVRAHGAVGRPVVERAHGGEVAFDVTIPASLQLTIEIGPDKNRFTAAVRIRLAVTARAAEPLRMVIDIETPTKSNVEVDRPEVQRMRVIDVARALDHLTLPD